MKNAKRLLQEQAQHQRNLAAKAHRMDQISAGQLVALLGNDAFPTASAAYETLMAHGKSTLDSLLNGLNHPNGKVRASCALLMDHLGDDRCAEPLIRVLKTDALEAVRRCALHSLACQRCKECPLETDVIAPILDAAMSDRSKQVRRRAVEYLSTQNPDPRVVEAMRLLISRESDPIIKKRAERTLTFHVNPAIPAVSCPVRHIP